MASLPSSRLKTLHIWGFKYPSSQIFLIAILFSIPASGFLRPYSPALTHMTEKPFIKAILIGRLGILPLAKPTINNRPPQFMHLME